MVFSEQAVSAPIDFDQFFPDGRAVNDKAQRSSACVCGKPESVVGVEGPEEADSVSGGGGGRREPGGARPGFQEASRCCSNDGAGAGSAARLFVAGRRKGLRVEGRHHAVAAGACNMDAPRPKSRASGSSFRWMKRIRLGAANLCVFARGKPENALGLRVISKRRQWRRC